MRTEPNRRRNAPTTAGVAAMDWALLQERGALTPAQERAFASWIAADEAHLAAYEDALWALDALADHAAAPEIMEMRATALAARGDRRRLWGLAGAGALAAAAAAAVFWVADPLAITAGRPAAPAMLAENPDHAEYRTRIGERSAITLPDGSVVTLDTDSRVRVAYGARERAVHLLQGQSMFEVAHGRPQPFTVYARGQRITAVGTVFNVRIEGEQVRVAMVEGTVRVQPRAVRRADGRQAPPPAALTLTAGEALVAEPARAVVESVDARRIASWAGGLLTFDDTPLSEAVAEINRYTNRPIAISDARIGAYRISGVFKPNDPDHFAHAMAEFLPVAVARTPDGATVLRAR